MADGAPDQQNADMTLDPMPPSPADVLILTGGRVIDPANQLDQIADVVVGDGRILAVGPDLAGDHPGAGVVDAAGLVVTPGLIDCTPTCIRGWATSAFAPTKPAWSAGCPS